MRFRGGQGRLISTQLLGIFEQWGAGRHLSVECGMRVTEWVLVWGGLGGCHGVTLRVPDMCLHASSSSPPQCVLLGPLGSCEFPASPGHGCAVVGHSSEGLRCEIVCWDAVCNVGVSGVSTFMAHRVSCVAPQQECDGLVHLCPRV